MSENRQDRIPTDRETLQALWVRAVAFIGGWYLFQGGARAIFVFPFEAVTTKYLTHAANYWPSVIGGLFDVLLPHAGVLAPLNGFGTLLAGLALMAGAALRFTLPVSGLLMFLYWMISMPYDVAVFLDKHWFLIFLLAGVAVYADDLRYTVDGWLKERFPDSRIVDAITL
ncbi:DoxX family protein [Halosimplex carlsbadense 2-9-1]|uniref:DoxX family protein n=1 Tax=Halosimplex carlsbadense 2-9-1 TaxID=797114 RepID=M0CXF4_9EURY|nr:hypothetical protein [Halosimplex carlsbadense]ELZ26549.1 DoxX family protein [Halosimplex carlsbadense 2-9-1]